MGPVGPGVPDLHNRRENLEHLDDLMCPESSRFPDDASLSGLTWPSLHVPLDQGHLGPLGIQQVQVSLTGLENQCCLSSLETQAIHQAPNHLARPVGPWSLWVAKQRA
ncbi:hypothetical protein EYF80_048167 [Liparis tanakae]|uniref:Uncharacterized protein n=1 Tax=Liparis tanakae TaxID=230148 RepID=A0A4Z2FKI8_9TELE|nr:hypothetical protein EYF80_048167 [Liparis tanakae]